MDKPVVLLADDPRTRGRVQAELGKRYGADYRVVVTGSAQEALEALGELRDGQAGSAWCSPVSGCAMEQERSCWRAFGRSIRPPGGYC